jgi:hypothetical protein
MLTADQKREIKKIVDSEMKAYKNDKQKKANSLKNDAEMREYVVNTIRDSLEDLFRTLWQRRSTWQREIGRK